MHLYECRITLHIVTVRIVALSNFWYSQELGTGSASEVKMILYYQTVRFNLVLSKLREAKKNV